MNSGLSIKAENKGWKALNIETKSKKLRGLTLNMISQIVYIPNFSVDLNSDGAISMPRADKNFVHKILKEYPVHLFAFNNANKNNSRDDFLISDRLILSLVDRKNSSGNIRKLISYASITQKVMWHFLFSDFNTFVYIYFPGSLGLIAVILAILTGRPFSLYVRGDWQRARIYRVLERLVFKKSKWVLATGNLFCEKIKPYCQNVSPVSPMVEFESVLYERKYLVNEPVRLLFVGYIMREKGVFEVIEALHELLANGVNCKLSIAGGGAKENVRLLANSIMNYDLDDRVDYFGHISSSYRLSEIYRDSDIFVYPSYSEGFPRVVYEAMLHGLPICCSILPGMVDFMVDRQNCVEVQTRKPESICKAVKSVMADKTFAEAIGKRAKTDVQFYLSKFGGNTHFDQLQFRLKGL